MVKVWKDKTQIMVARRVYCDGCGQLIIGTVYSVDSWNESKEACSKECVMKLLNRDFDRVTRDGRGIFIQPTSSKTFGAIPDDAGWV